MGKSGSIDGAKKDEKINEIWLDMRFHRILLHKQDLFPLVFCFPSFQLYFSLANALAKYKDHSSNKMLFIFLTKFSNN